MLAQAERGRAAVLRCEFVRAEFRALVGAVAKGLVLRPAAGAEEIGLVFFKVDNGRGGAGDLRFFRHGGCFRRLEARLPVHAAEIFAARPEAQIFDGAVAVEFGAEDHGPGAGDRNGQAAANQGGQGHGKQDGLDFFAGAALVMLDHGVKCRREGLTSC